MPTIFRIYRMGHSACPPGWQNIALIKSLGLVWPPHTWSGYALNVGLFWGFLKPRIKALHVRPIY